MEPTSAKNSSTDHANGSSPNRIYVLLLFLLASVLTVSARLSGLNKYGLWWDEVFSLRIARSAWDALFQQVINDAVHPPLFYILLKLWIMAGGESLIWLKIFPVIFAVGAVALLWPLCKELQIRFAEFTLALIFISLNSYLIYYAQELRMYTLFLFLSLVSMWLFVKFLRDDSNSKLPIILLFVVNALLVYTQYFGWMTVLAECVVVLFYGRSRSKLLLAQTFAVGLCFLPWFILVVTAMAQKGGLSENLGWINKPGVSAIPLFLADLNGKLEIRYATTLSLLIFTPPLLIWLWQIYRDRSREEATIFGFLGLVTAFPILLAFLVSQVGATSVWVERYLIAAAIPYMLLLAVSISRIKNVAVSRLFITLTVCWSLGVGAWSFYAQRTRVNWIGLSNSILERGSTDAVPKVFVLEVWSAEPLRLLVDKNGAQPPRVQKIGGIDEISENEFWLSYRQTTWKGTDSAKEELLRKNCIVQEDLSDKINNETVHLLFVDCGN